MSAVVRMRGQGNAPAVRFRAALWVVLCSATLGQPAVAHYGPAQSPRLRINRLRTVTFTVEVTVFSLTRHGTEAATQAFSVKAKPPGRIRIEAAPVPPKVNGQGRLSFTALATYDVLVSDGVRQLELIRDMKLYVAGPAEPKIADIRCRGSIDRVVGTDVIFDDDLGQFMRTGTERLGGQSAQVYTFVAPLQPSRMLKLLVSAKSGLPLRLSEIETVDGRAVEQIRRVYSEWRSNVKLPRDTFDPTPPSDGRPSDAARRQ